MRRLVLVLGDQLNFDSAAFDDLDADRDAVLMIEARHESTYVPQHKQRLVLFCSSMRHFRDALRERGLTAHYAALGSKHNRGSFREEIPRWVQKTRAKTLVVAQPGNYPVQADLRGALRGKDCALDIRPDGHFLRTEEQFEEFAEGMQQSQRAAHNPALEHAVKYAREVRCRSTSPEPSISRGQMPPSASSGQSQNLGGLPWALRVRGRPATRGWTTMSGGSRCPKNSYLSRQRGGE